MLNQIDQVQDFNTFTTKVKTRPPNFLMETHHRIFLIPQQLHLDHIPYQIQHLDPLHKIVLDI